MDSMPPTAATTATPSDAPARALAVQQLRRLEEISLTGLVLAQQIEHQAREANRVGSGGDLMFARTARAVRQTIALEIQTCPGGDASVTERRMKLLGGVADAGVSLIVLLRDQVLKSGWYGPDEALMFARIARAVRQTQAMETRVDGDSRLTDDERAAAQAKRANLAARVRKRRQALGVEAADADELSDAEGLLGDCREALDDRTIDAELAGRPVAEVVASACKDLGFACDLSVFAEPAGEDVAAAHEAMPATAENTNPGIGGVGRVTPAGHAPMGHDPP